MHGWEKKLNFKKTGIAIEKKRKKGSMILKNVKNRVFEKIFEN